MSDTPKEHWLGKPQAELIAELEASHRLRIAAESASAAAQAAEKRFRDITESACDWFWETGPDLRLTRIGGPDGRLDGASRDRLLGQNLPALAGQGGGGSPPSSAPSRFDDLEQRRAFRNLECLITGNDGRRRCMNLSGTPIFDGCGRFAGYRGSAVDITDRKDSELFINNIIETIPDPIFVKDQ